MGEFAARLVEARHGGPLIGPTEFEPPPDHQAALLVQRSTTAMLADAPAGWKVAMLPDGRPVTAPLLATRLLSSHSTFALSSAKVAELEIELAFRLGADIPPGATREQVLASVSEVSIGAEIVASRLVDDEAAGFTQFLADSLGNAGYVIGSGLQFTRHLPVTGLHCRVILDDQLVYDAHGHHVMGDPLLPLIVYAGDRLREDDLSAGQLVTTGTLSGQALLPRSCTILASLSGIGVVEFAVVQEVPLDGIGSPP